MHLRFQYFSHRFPTNPSAATVRSSVTIPVKCDLVSNVEYLTTWSQFCPRICLGVAILGRDWGTLAKRYYY